MIRFENVAKYYNNDTLLKNINITISDGEVVSIIGPSGNGKSTFIRLIDLLDKPSEGKIFIDDQELNSINIVEVRKKIGMMFQNYSLFNHMTVLQNVMNPQMDVLNRDKKEAYDNAIKNIDLVSMSEKLDNYPSSLANGQIQRVAFARMLAMDPSILLLDEPTSALDPNMASEVEAIINELALSQKTIIIVTNDMTLARKVSTRILYLDDKTIYEEGSPEEIFDKPKKEKTKAFINNLKLLTQNIESKNADWWALGAEIDNYAIKNHISSKGSTRLRLAFEELVREIIVERIEEPRINIVTEYSHNKEILKMTVRYSGDRFDPKDTENELSYHVLSSTVSDIKYTSINEDVYNNKLEIIINNSK